MRSPSGKLLQEVVYGKPCLRLLCSFLFSFFPFLALTFSVSNPNQERSFAMDSIEVRFRALHTEVNRKIGGGGEGGL